MVIFTLIHVRICVFLWQVIKSKSISRLTPLVAANLGICSIKMYLNLGDLLNPQIMHLDLTNKNKKDGPKSV